MALVCFSKAYFLNLFVLTNLVFEYSPYKTPQVSMRLKRNRQLETRRRTSGSTKKFTRQSYVINTTQASRLNHESWYTQEKERGYASGRNHNKKNNLGKATSTRQKSLSRKQSQPWKNWKQWLNGPGLPISKSLFGCSSSLTNLVFWGFLNKTQDSTRILRDD